MNARVLTCWCSARFLRLTQFRTPSQGNGAAHSGRVPPTSTNLTKTIPHKLTQPTGQPTVDSPSLRISSQVTLGFVKMTTLAVTPIKKPGMVIYTCHCSAGEMETAGSWGSLASWPTLNGELQASHGTLSSNIR